jgi:hypothetical protein
MTSASIPLPPVQLPCEDYNWVSLASTPLVLAGYMAWTDNRDVVPGTDQGETTQDGFDVHMCVTVSGAVATAVDHIVPRSQGGRSTPGNLRATCKTCNSLKSRSEASLAALARRQAGSVPIERTPGPDPIGLL